MGAGLELPCLLCVGVVALTMSGLAAGDPLLPPQELVEIAGRSAGVVLMAPPSDSAEGRASVSTLLSALKKQKARAGGAGRRGWLGSRQRGMAGV